MDNLNKYKIRLNLLNRLICEVEDFQEQETVQQDALAEHLHKELLNLRFMVSYDLKAEIERLEE